MRARRLDSSMIDRIVFDDEALTLSVSFKPAGQRYLYLDVPREVYEALAEAPSAGRFFNECVRDRYAWVPERRRYPLT